MPNPHGRLTVSAAISVLLEWLLLSESPSALALAGGALCLFGVVVARR